jgi:hypothetical protein
MEARDDRLSLRCEEVVLPLCMCMVRRASSRRPSRAEDNLSTFEWSARTRSYNYTCWLSGVARLLASRKPLTGYCSFMMGWGSTCTSALRYKQLLVCPDSMKRDTVASNSVDDEKVCPEMTLGKASPIGAAFAEAVFSKCFR